MKLADFGIVGELSDPAGGNSHAKTFTGTLSYMSPERVRGEPYKFPVGQILMVLVFPLLIAVCLHAFLLTDSTERHLGAWSLFDHLRDRKCSFLSKRWFLASG